MIEIVLDTETTGLSVTEGHRIVEIGCIELKNQIPTKNKFHCILNPERKVSEKAFDVHGYSNKFLEDKKKFKEIADEFLNFIEEKTLIIHNAEFDLGHLNNELALIGKKPIKKERVIDTLELAKIKYPGSLINLDSLCKRFKIDNSKRTKHNALIDCDLLSKVYINLIDQKEPTLNFNAKENNLQGDLRQRSKIIFSKKIIKPSSKDLDLHKSFIKSEIKKNFYY